MKRLTKRDSGGNAVVDCDICEMGESRLANCGVLKCRNRLKDRLAYYEDAEEQGRLIVLPCKVGDTLFWTDRGIVTSEIIECRVDEFCVDTYGPFVVLDKVSPYKYRWRAAYTEMLGYKLFLSREEAEKALEGMK